MCQNDSGPEARCSAPAGPEMLSVADGVSPTSRFTDRQAAKIEPAVIVVQPVAEKVGFFRGHLTDYCVFGPSRTPFCDAARQLLDLGWDAAALLVMRHADSTHECLRAPISFATALTVEESAHGPVFRSHRTGPRSAVEASRVRSGDGPRTPGPYQVSGMANAVTARSRRGGR
jgi:hypothetical protein